jgi:hypothetical protein
MDTLDTISEELKRVTEGLESDLNTYREQMKIFLPEPGRCLTQKGGAEDPRANAKGLRSPEVDVAATESLVRWRRPCVVMQGGAMPVEPVVAEAGAKEPVQPRGRERASFGGDRLIKLYLREIGQVKKLTPQAEIELAARIKKGDKRARAQMIKANLRLVVKIARDFEGLGLPLLDLISEGNLGLLKAVERFDPAKGEKLSTCGSWWIKHSIKRAMVSAGASRVNTPRSTP